jgi:diaminopimelate epimerase
MVPRPNLQLTKHHGAGNDFLVVLDMEDRRRLGAAEVRALCDRRRGIGADGLLRVTAPGPGADIGMELHNADGSPAVMSGNGIRCLTQAAVDAGLVRPGPVTVSTPVGLRHVEYRAEGDAGVGYASVDMGRVELGAELDASERHERWRAGAGTAVGDGSDALLHNVERGRIVTTGNPHLVLWTAPVAPDVVATLGAALDAGVAGGANVEFVWAGPRAGELTLRVWERGAGMTLACGTGSCAAAGAAMAWGLGRDRVVVHNPGGALEVTLVDGSARLAGPTQRIGDVVMDEEILAVLAGLPDVLGARAAG